MFKILLGIDALAALAIVYFFIAGLADGSVSDFNIHLWVAIVCAISGIVVGGVILRKASYLKLANIVLAILAVPAFLYGIFILAVVLSDTRWN